MRTRAGRFVRTRYRTRRFSPPPSSSPISSSAVTEIIGAGTGTADTDTAVAAPAAQAATTTETGRLTDRGAAPTRPSLTASEVELDSRGENSPAADEEGGEEAKNDNPAPPPALGQHALSTSPSGCSSRSVELSAADKALIELSNHNFFKRGREHEAAVAHRVACELALERVKMHKRLGLRIDEWDEELALEGLPPLQRWRTLRPEGDVQEKENRGR